MNMRGIILKSQLYGRARDLVWCVSDGDFKSKEGVKRVVNTMYKRNAFAVLSDGYID